LNNPLRIIGIVDRNAIDSHGFGRVVIATHIQGIADINHLVYRYTEDVSQFSDAISFIDARLGYVDSYLASPVFNLLSPDLFDLETCSSDRLLERTKDFIRFIRSEIF